MRERVKRKARRVKQIIKIAPLVTVITVSLMMATLLADYTGDGYSPLDRL